GVPPRRGRHSTPPGPPAPSDRAGRGSLRSLRLRGGDDGHAPPHHTHVVPGPRGGRPFRTGSRTGPGGPCSRPRKRRGRRHLGLLGDLRPEKRSPLPITRVRCGRRVRPARRRTTHLGHDPKATNTLITPGKVIPPRSARGTRENSPGPLKVRLVAHVTASHPGGRPCPCPVRWFR